MSSAKKRCEVPSLYTLITVCEKERGSELFTAHSGISWYLGRKDSVQSLCPRLLLLRRSPFFLSVVLLQFTINHIAEMMKNNFSATGMHSKKSGRYLKSLSAFGMLPDTSVSVQNNWTAVQQEEQVVLHRGRNRVWKCWAQATPLRYVSSNSTLTLSPRRTFKT